MAKVFLYPSNQWANQYAYDETNEGVQMNLIADYIQESLELYEVQVFRSDNALNYIGGCNKVNEVDPDLCLCIHSNAFDGNVTGTETYYSPAVKGSKDWAALIQSKIAPLMPSKDRGIFNGTYPDGRNIGYLNRINCVNALVEVEFHDVTGTAEWIINHKREIADALVKAIASYLGLKPKSVTAGGFAVGDVVKVKKETLFATGQKPADWVFNTNLYVRELISGNRVKVSTSMTASAITGIFNSEVLTKGGSNSSPQDGNTVILTVSTKLLPLVLNSAFDIKTGKAKGPKLARMPKGSKVELLQKMNTAWYKVKYKGLTGYASSEYLK